MKVLHILVDCCEECPYNHYSSGFGVAYCKALISQSLDIDNVEIEYGGIRNDCPLPDAEVGE